MKKTLRILSLLLALVFVLSLAPLAAFAEDNYDDIEENPAGHTYDANYAEIGTNNGTVVLNEDMIDTNAGTIGDLSDPDAADQGNAGFVLNNTGTVTVNMDTGYIVENEGTIGTNKGSLGSNNEGGKVTTNENEIYYNDGMIGTNNKTVNYNLGEIMTNAAGSTVSNNTGTIGANFSTVTTNDGTVMFNYSTVTTNNGKIEANYLYGEITTNNGELTNNSGTVKINTGTVSNNYQTVEYNAGGTVKGQKAPLNDGWGLKVEGLTEGNTADVSGSPCTIGDTSFVPKNAEGVEVSVEKQDGYTLNVDAGGTSFTTAAEGSSWKVSFGTVLNNLRVIISRLASPAIVEDRSGLDAQYMSFICDVVEKIGQAPENGTVEIDAGSWRSYRTEVFQALALRSDVTLTTTYKGESGLMRFTIRAGTDVLGAVGRKTVVEFPELAALLGVTPTEAGMKLAPRS